LYDFKDPSSTSSSILYTFLSLLTFSNIPEKVRKLQQNKICMEFKVKLDSGLNHTLVAEYLQIQIITHTQTGGTVKHGVP
jgi:hypothetical protein